MGVFKKISYKITYCLKMAIYSITYGKSIEVGKGFSFRKRFEINMNDVNAQLKIGKNIFFNNDCSINCKGRITIGDNCIFGEGVKIYDHNHRFREVNVPIYEQGYKTGSIIVGTNCWIGSNVILLSGANIGDNVVIGAGCVISGKIPDEVIVTAGRELHLTRREYHAE